MRRPTLPRLVAAALFCLSSPLLAEIELSPVTSGLSSPVFAGNAGDGSNRLFVVEQAGTIRVLQPGASATTLFLDLHTKVLSGGERGLLGLAFHPQYAGNGRFFVYYTRTGDGAIVVSEYHVSGGNPNAASTAETVLLTIPHPTNANHNGGMLAFGPDGYLYLGVGDGGAGNDPPNNAQNINALLGKLLRIDVDRPDPVAGTRYSSPPDNPYIGVAGRDEIFSIGWRNPWRFSFDRASQQLWVADVGQGLREEVDTPIANGGNYGWRIYEGSLCTNNDPALCTASNYLFPIFDYTHSSGRCSITGGYVYQGGQGTLPLGTYVYGDYCSGEIFTWNGAAQSVLLDTAMHISSFGEDEEGELYVVDLDGAVSRIASTTATPPPPPSCTFSLSPTQATYPKGGGTGSLTVSAPAGCAWTAVSNTRWIRIVGGSSGAGNGAVTYTVGAMTGSRKTRQGTATIAGEMFLVRQSR